MIKVKEIIIVEGKHDESFLKTFLDARIIITDGTSLPSSTKELLKQLSKDNDFIILTDPDYPGSYIRNELLKILPNAKVANIRKNHTRKPGTIGVENATKEEILLALDNLITYDKYQEAITLNDLLELGLTNNKQSSELRKKICDKLFLGSCNSKQLIKKLNMLGLTREKLLQKLKDIINER